MQFHSNAAIVDEQSFCALCVITPILVHCWIFFFVFDLNCDWTTLNRISKVNLFLFLSFFFFKFSSIIIFIECCSIENWFLLLNWCTMADWCATKCEFNFFFSVLLHRANNVCGFFPFEIHFAKWWNFFGRHHVLFWNNFFSIILFNSMWM